jgi:hypothetical protein
MRKMCGVEGSVVQPCSNPAVKSYYDKKYRVFLEMYKDQAKYATLMTSSTPL